MPSTVREAEMTAKWVYPGSSQSVVLVTQIAMATREEAGKTQENSSLYSQVPRDHRKARFWTGDRRQEKGKV